MQPQAAIWYNIHNVDTLYLRILGSAFSAENRALESLRRRKTQILMDLKKKRRPYMFRMWGKLFKDNRLLKDMVACNSDYSMSRTSMVFQALDELCHEFDLGQPIWLETNIRDFKRQDKTRFTKDNFIETIDFDYLEIQVLEE